jgi:hypothetical protein
MDYQQAGKADAGPHNPVSTAYDEKLTQESAHTSRLSSQLSNHSLEIRDAPENAPEEKAHVTQDDQIVEEKGAELEGLKKIKSKHSVRDAGSIPDGGLWAWLQVLGGFFLLFNSWYVQPPSSYPSPNTPFRSQNLTSILY